MMMMKKKKEEGKRRKEGRLELEAPFQSGSDVTSVPDLGPQFPPV